MLTAMLIMSLLCAAFVVVRYRWEGVLAIYFNGLPLYLLTIFFMGIDPPTLVTGIVSTALGALVLIRYAFYRDDPEDPSLPRRFSLSWFLLFALSLYWLAHHLFERAVIGMESIEDVFKWGYGVSYWTLALLVGYVFPPTAQRMQRLIRGVGIVGLGTIAIIFACYFGGVPDRAQEWGYRYCPAPRLSPLNYAICASVSTAAIIGGYVVCQRQKVTGRRIVFCAIALTMLVGAPILAGTRSSLLIILGTGVLALGTLKFRYIPIGLTALVVAGLLWILLVLPLLPSLGAKRAATAGEIQQGFGVRFALILDAIPAIQDFALAGRTIGLESVMGISYSHNFTLQVMLENGLIGFAAYLAAFISIMVGYLRAARYRGTTLYNIAVPLLLLFAATFLEAHAHERLMNYRMWTLLGLLAAHRPVIENEYAEMEYLTEAYGDYAAVPG